jgi:glycosyltransferase involved in cell wall biosynthesis
MPIRIRCEYSLYRYWGVPTRYIDLTRYLDPELFHVTSHGTSDVEQGNELPDWLENIRPWVQSWIQRGGMPWYKLGDLGAEVEALRSCKAGESNIVHFMDGEHSARFLPSRLKECSLPKIRTVATFHQPPDLLPGLVSWETLRSLDAIILVSPSQIPFFRSHITEDKLHVILLGVDTELFHPRPVPNSSDTVVCITTGLNLRDWDTFNQVAQALTGIKFIVVTSAKIKLKRSTNVEVHSGLSDAALAAMYRSADVVFLPLLDATANNTLLEGIATGLPVVATDLEAVRAYVSDEAAIFVKNNDVDEFVAAISRLQHDADLRNKMGRSARVRALELGWPNIIKQYEALYRNIAEKPENVSNSKRDAIVAPAYSNEAKSNLCVLEKCSTVYFKDTPDDGPPAIDVWGYALTSAGLIDEANTLFKALATSFPDDFRGYAGLAELAERRWQWKTALECWNKAVPAAPRPCHAQLAARKARCLVQIGQIDLAKQLLISVSDQLEGLIGLARIASMTAPPKTASAHWEHCTKRYPDQIDGFLGLAMSFIDAGSYAEADALLEHAIAVWPESSAARILSARTATAAGRLDMASDRWSILINSEGNREHEHKRDIRVGYARYLGLAGDRNGAEKYLAYLVDRPAEIAEFLLEYHLAQNDLEAAIQHGYKLVEWSKHEPFYCLRQVMLLLRSGSPKALQSAYSIISNLYDKLPEAIEAVAMKVELARLCISLERDDEANQVIDSIAANDNRIQVEILRLWQNHNRDGNLAAKEYWKMLFLDLDIIGADENYPKRGNLPFSS